MQRLLTMNIWDYPAICERMQQSMMRRVEMEGIQSSYYKCTLSAIFHNKMLPGAC
jgi:hypothetical protein